MESRNFDEIMKRFSGVYRNYTGPVKTIPEDSILNAPCFIDKYGNVVVDTMNATPHQVLQSSYPKETTTTAAEINTNNGKSSDNKRKTKSGHKGMTMWDKNLKDVILPVPENTSELTSKEITKRRQYT